MNCDQAATLLVEGVTGNLEARDAELLRAHLRECVACRAEESELRALWTQLGRLPAPAPPPDAAARFLQMVPHAALPGRASRARRQIAAAGALAASLLGGVLLGRALPNDDAPAAGAPAAAGVAESERQFLLLLYETPATVAPNDAEGRRRVSEYTAWAGALSERGLLVGAEKLADDGGRWLTGRGSASDARPLGKGGLVGGYFVIRAGSYEEALGIARECPHVKYGGDIEVRAIERV